MSKDKSNIDIKVCHVTSAHPRYDVRIFHKECKSLAKRGFDVTLLVNDKMEDELIDGVKIKSTHYSYKNRYGRMIKSRKQIKEKAIEIDANIYHFHDPELLPIASVLKRRRKKVIFDFHEDVSQQILFKMWIPRIIRKIVSSLYKIYELIPIKKFDALITVTPKFVERLKKANPNTIMVTNYPIISDMEDEDNIAGNKCNNICFAGCVSPQWNHLNIINAIEQIDDISYKLAGSGSKEYLGILKNLEGWNRVDYLGRIPHKEVKKIYLESIIGMTLLSHNTQVGDEGTLGNTKIFEYMEAGLPIICSNNKLWKQIVDDYKCGIAVDPNNVEEIRNAIIELRDNNELSMQMGRNGRRAVETKFNWKVEEKKLVEVYDKMLSI